MAKLGKHDRRIRLYDPNRTGTLGPGIQIASSEDNLRGRYWDHPRLPSHFEIVVSFTTLADYLGKPSSD